MLTAIDMETGKELSIENAKRHRDYLCPCCGGKVDAVFGLQLNYFKHKYGTKRVDCENYRAGIGNSFGGWKEEIESRQRLALFGSAYISKGYCTWFLEIFLPQLAGLRDLIITDGYSGSVIIPSGSIKQGGIKVRVLPKESQYLINQVENGYEPYVRMRLQGLTINKINVFSFSESSGRLLDDSLPLVQGQTYLMVYHKSLLNVTETLEEYFDLGDLNDWHAIIYKIPISITCLHQQWINRYLSREVCLPNISLKVISPARYINLPNGSVVVPNDSETVISINGVNGSKVPGLLGIKSNLSLKPEWLPLKGTLPQAIDFGMLEDGTYDLLIPGESRAYLEIIVRKFPAVNERFSIQLMFDQLDSDEKITVPIFSDEIVNLLEKVKKGKCLIEDFVATEGLPLTIQFKKSGQEWETYTRQLDNSLSMDLEVRNKIIESIKNNWRFIFNAGNFGSFRIEPKTKQFIEHQSICLPDYLRRKIEWFSSANGNTSTKLQIYVAGYSYRSITHRILNRFGQKDQELIKKLVTNSIRRDLFQVYLDLIIRIRRISERGMQV